MPSVKPGKITTRPGIKENETEVRRAGQLIGRVYRRRVRLDGFQRPKSRWEAFRYGHVLPLGHYRTKREAVAAFS